MLARLTSALLAPQSEYSLSSSSQSALILVDDGRCDECRLFRCGRGVGVPATVVSSGNICRSSW